MIPITAWEVIRCVFFLACFTIVPGLVITHFIHPDRKQGGLGPFSWWVGWSMVVNAVLAYCVHAVGGSLQHYAAAIIILDLVGITTLLAQRISRRYADTRQHYDSITYGRLALLIAALWFGVMLWSGPRIDYRWDHWFHIAHVREAMDTNSIVPGNPYWSDVPLSDMYGLWHSVVGAVGRSASVDVLPLWRTGNAFMAALAFLVIYSVAGDLFTTDLTRLVAALVFLGSSALPLDMMRTSMYPWGIATLLMWISLGHLYSYLKEGDSRQLVSAMLVGLIPAMIHPQEYVFLCFGALSLFVSAVVVRRVRPATPIDPKRVGLAMALIVLLGLPVLALEYPNRVAAATNVQSTGSVQSNGLVLYGDTLAKLLAVAFPYYHRYTALKYSLITFNLISLVFVFLLPRPLDRRLRWFLTTLTWAPVIASIVPGLSLATQAVLRETYAYRLLNLVPTPFVWAPAIIEVIAARTTGRRRESGIAPRFAGPLGWAYFTVVLMMISGIGVSIVLTLGRSDRLDDPRSPLSLPSRHMYDALSRASRGRSVVLSDPMTSYAVPGLTQHYVVLNEPAHGSRDDMDARFIEARELLSSPHQSNEDAIATLARYDVDFITVSKVWLLLDHYLGTPFYSDYTLDFLQMNADCFRPIYRDSAFETFEYVGCEPEQLRGKSLPRPDPVSPMEVQHPSDARFTDELALAGFAYSISQGQDVGTRLVVDLYWQAQETISIPYHTSVELLCDYPGKHLPYGKAVRMMSDALTGNIHQVESDAWLPVPPGGMEGNELFHQGFELELPEQLVGGPCRLSVFVLGYRQALYGPKMLPIWLMEKEYTHPGVELATLVLPVDPRQAIYKDYLQPGRR